MSKINREAVALRDAYCPWCGKPLPADFAAHHRKLRSRGGTDELSNVIGLCHPCHNLGTHSVHLNVKLATDKGFLVSSWDTPTSVPLTLPNGDKVLLMDDGTVVRTGAEP